MRARATINAILIFVAGIIGAVQSARNDHNYVLHMIVGLLFVAVAINIAKGTFRRRTC